MVRRCLSVGAIIQSRHSRRLVPHTCSQNELARGDRGCDFSTFQPNALNDSFRMLDEDAVPIMNHEEQPAGRRRQNVAQQY